MDADRVAAISSDAKDAREGTIRPFASWHEIAANEYVPELVDALDAAQTEVARLNDGWSEAESALERLMDGIALTTDWDGDLNEELALAYVRRLAAQVADALVTIRYASSPTLTWPGTPPILDFIREGATDRDVRLALWTLVNAAQETLSRLTRTEEPPATTEADAMNAGFAAHEAMLAALEDAAVSPSEDLRP